MQLNGNRIIIWGAKDRGRVILKVLRERLNIDAECFVDRDINLIDQQIDGIYVLSDVNFITKYNADDVLIIIGGYNPQNKEQITEFLEKNNFTGKLMDTYEFHHMYEIPVLLQREDKKVIDYESKIQQWFKSFLAEAHFWRDEVINPEGYYHNHYLARVDSSKEFECDRVKEFVKQDSVILDVGCGICSNYGKGWNGKQLSLIGVDPLAHIYNRLNQRAFSMGCTNGKMPDGIKFGMFEMLSYMIEKNSADIILIDNALDHCIDPISAILECLRVVKKYGVVSTFHHINEAYKAFYADMHQWNICSNEEGHLVVWNNESCIDINKLLGEYVEITTYVHENHVAEIPFGGLVCNIVKKKDIPDDFMDETKERLGMVMNQVMLRISDPEFMLEYLEFYLHER